MHDSAEEARDAACASQPWDAFAARILGEVEVASFDNLYVAHAREAHRIAFGILGDASLASDAVHAGFIEMLRYLLAGKRWYEPGDARAMVLRNVRWAALSMHRARRRARQGFTALEPQADPGVEWARSEARALCRQVVSRLDGNHQATLRLRYVDGLTNVEAAHQLGISVGAFESRVQRALRAARKAARSSGLLSQVAIVPGLSGCVRWAVGRCVLRPAEHRRWIRTSSAVAASALLGAGVLTSLMTPDSAGPPEPAAPAMLAATTHVAGSPDTINDAVVVDALQVSGEDVVALAEDRGCGCLVLFQSTDGGGTWASAPGPAKEAGTVHLAVAAAYPSDPRILVSSDSSLGAQVSDRFGEPFHMTRASASAVEAGTHAAVCAPQDLVYCAAEPFATGRTTGVNTGGLLLAMGDDRWMYFVPAGGVTCSYDRGVSWSSPCRSGPRA